MNNIDIYNKDYEIFKTHYDDLNELMDAIDQEITKMAIKEKTTLIVQKLLKLREFINEAITYCGETMYEDMRLMGQELIHMKEDLKE